MDVGRDDGPVGFFVGRLVGFFVGFFVGRVGFLDGFFVGREVGLGVGFFCFVAFRSIRIQVIRPVQNEICHQRTEKTGLTIDYSAPIVFQK